MRYLWCPINSPSSAWQRSASPGESRALADDKTTEAPTPAKGRRVGSLRCREMVTAASKPEMCVKWCRIYIHFLNIH